MPRANRRPTVLPDMVRVETTVPTEVDEAINVLVGVSGGQSKASLLRSALLAGLAPYALVSPELADALQPTTYGRNKK